MEPSHVEAQSNRWRLKIWTPGLLLIALATVAGVAWMGVSTGNDVSFFHYFMGLSLLCSAGLAISSDLIRRLSEEASRRSTQDHQLLTDLSKKQMELIHEQAQLVIKVSSKHTAQLADIATQLVKARRVLSIASRAAQHGAAADDCPQAGDRG